MLSESILKQESEILNYVKNLGVPIKKINDKNLLLQSFVHKSFSADNKNMISHNERLEFVGDGILGAVINKLLFLEHSDMAESELTLYKIVLVREEILAEVARDIGLDKMLFLSKGEEKMHGRQKDVILADGLEAIIGFFYIDLGIEVVENFIKKYIYSKFEQISKIPIRSYKTMIQELVQKKFKITPQYIDVENKKDDKGNVLEYKSELIIQNKKEAEGFGINKKKAQEDSARNYYEKLEKKKP
ncbi:MAG: ribonuclease III [Candidatus Absconditabacterales bacterium]